MEPAVKRTTIEAGAESICNFSIRVDDIKALKISNRASLCVSVERRPQLPELPLVFIGANRWLASKIFREETKASSLENNPEPAGIDENWTVVNFLENELKLEE